MSQPEPKGARKRERAPDNLYQRNGVWWIRYNVAGRKIRRSLGTPNVREAKRLRDQILGKRSVAAKFGIEEPIPRKQWTFGEVVEAWLQSRRAGELRANTIRDSETMGKLWLLPKLGDQPISEITVEDVENFIAHLRNAHSATTGKKLSRDYIAKLTKNLGAIFRFAQKRRMLHGVNPYAQLDRRPTAGPPRDVSLTVDEARRLLAKFTGATYYKVALALATGLRWGEIHGLAWVDVDLDGTIPSITIRRSWRGDPKSYSSATTIPISDDAAATLRLWKAEQGQVVQADGPTVYVFPDRAGKIRKRSCRREERRIAKAAKDAGIVSKVSPHVFRHSFATWAYERVQDPRKLQRLMRHASFQTSMGYVHDRVNLGAVVNTLPALSQARLQAV